MLEKIKPYFKTYAIAIAIPLTVGIIAAALTRESMDIYGMLNKPPLSPPAILFPIVWTVLYVLMGVSSGLVYSNRENNEKAAKNGLKYYAISLAFNFLWSIIFFRLNSLLLAFICLLVLLYFIIRTVIEYNKVFPIAAYLQIPYVVWVSFAGYLNLALVFLN